jgi:DNA sulfur modification protein DndE
MIETKWNRLRLSGDLTYRLRNAKGRTGLTPNILCRLGFCLSLADPRVPDPDHYDEDGQEFNRSTLLGSYDELYSALLRQRLAHDSLDPKADFFPYLRAHMNRGAAIVCGRLRNISDVLTLVPK